MEEKNISFILNGKEKRVSAVPGETLLKYLRGKECLRGTKNGCSTGHCGACTVIIDGEAKRSCIVPLKQLEGKTVLTIEGLNQEQGLHPIQQAFIDAGAVQCGYCTPGMIMASKALLDKNPDPNNDEIKEALKDNYCRCTGYVKIIDAVKLAAKMLKGREKKALDGFGIGISMPDIDGAAKVRGELSFAGDMSLPGMTYGKILWAAHPHAIIRGVNINKAGEYPGVLKVLTADDVPGLNGFGIVKPDQPVLCRDKVRFLGDAVALVVAESEEAASKAVKLIEVDYEPIEGIYSIKEALRESAPKIHDEGNICKQLLHEKGSVKDAKGKAFINVKMHFETPAVEHAYLEPEAGVAVMDTEDRLTLYMPTQAPFDVKRQLSDVLNLPQDKVRVIVTPLGGGFGGKGDATIEFLIALGAYHVRRPFKIVLTREESLRVSTKRHPFVLDYEVGATEEGKLLYVDAKLLSDAGPYSNLSPRVIDQACIFACGPYVVPNIRVEGCSLHTNNSCSGAFRGFGINQASIAIESIMDEIAHKLDMDPFDLRNLNALDIGDETSSGEILKASVATKATINQAKEATYRTVKEISKKTGEGNTRIGVGVASAFKNVGAGKGRVDDAGAILELKEDGNIRIRVSAVDMGQGIRTTMSQITCETIGFEAGQLEIITGDTLLTPKHGSAVGERQTFISGNAMYHAAMEFLDNIKKKVASIYGVDAKDIVIEGKKIKTKDGKLVDDFSGLSCKLKERNENLRAEYYYTAPRTFSLADIEGRKSVPKEEYRNFPTYAYTTQVAIVEVNTETGKVKLLKVIASHDVGRVINLQKIQGQVEGSCAMGQGYALSESYIVEKGIHKTLNYKKLGVPSIAETPEYEILIVEDPEPNGPYGAKGIAEVATVPITPAILNAIYDAVGVRITSLPATPDKIMEQLQKETN